MNNIYASLFLLASLLGFSSCEGLEKEDIYVAIKSVQATAAVPVQERADWHFYVNEKEYNYVVNGRILHAQVKPNGEAAYYVIYGSQTLDSLPNIGPGSINLVFASSDYPFPIKEFNVSTEHGDMDFAEVLDQSTKKKIMDVDALSVKHTGMLSPYIDNVKLAHRHNLMTYSLEGFPEDAKIQLLTSGKEVKPFVDEGLYSAVLVNPQRVVLRASVGDEALEISMKDAIKALPAEFRLSKDMCYHLVLKCDEAAAEGEKKLTVSSIEGRKWSVYNAEELESEKNTEQNN